jgi:hypothetical protein
VFDVFWTNVENAVPSWKLLVGSNGYTWLIWHEEDAVKSELSMSSYVPS